MPLKLSMLWMVAGLAVLFAFLAGIRHERNRAAKRENAVLTRELLNTRAAARELHEMALSIQAMHRADVEQLNAIASDFEVSREQQQTHFTRQRAALSRLLENRPDLNHPAGADILRHWTASNAGADVDAADTAPATGSGGIDAAVPDIADAGERSLVKPDCKPRCGHGALPLVPGDAATFDRGNENMGADREAELLCGAATRGDSGGGMR